MCVCVCVYVCACVCVCMYDKKTSMIKNLWYAYSITLFDNILTKVIFVQSNIYRLKSAMRKKAFSYSKTGRAPVSLDR